MFGTRSQVRKAGGLEAEQENRKVKEPPSKPETRRNKSIVVKKSANGRSQRAEPPSKQRDRTKRLPDDNSLDQPANITRERIESILAPKKYITVVNWLDQLPYEAELQETISKMPPRSSNAAGAEREQTPKLKSKPKPAPANVKSSQYRSLLTENGIRILSPIYKLPENIEKIVATIFPKEPIQPTPASTETLRLRADGAIAGINESAVRNYFKNLEVFAELRFRSGHRLKSAENLLVDSGLVPNIPPCLRISTPKPDLYVGYDHEYLESPLERRIPRFEAAGLRLPFFQAEFKGDGPNSSGTLWVATNQLAGGAATFLSMLNRLKKEVLEMGHEAEAEAIEPVCFGLVSNGTETRLFVAYSDDNDGKFKLFFYRGFLMYQESAAEELGAYLKKIVEWGGGKRLEYINAALNALGSSAFRDDDLGLGLGPTGESVAYDQETVTQARTSVDDGNEYGITLSHSQQHSTSGQIPHNPRRSGRIRARADTMTTNSVDELGSMRAPKRRRR